MSIIILIDNPIYNLLIKLGRKSSINSKHIGMVSSSGRKSAIADINHDHVEFSNKAQRRKVHWSFFQNVRQRK